MCSWGDIAVGEVRPSAVHPSKSAILGLIAAAIGLKRPGELALRFERSCEIVSNAAGPRRFGIHAYAPQPIGRNVDLAFIERGLDDLGNVLVRDARVTIIVAAIFLAMMPDFPMPETITRPEAARIAFERAGIWARTGGMEG